MRLRSAAARRRHGVRRGQAGRLWSLALNLEHIAAGCSDRGTLCRFLLKRAGAKPLLLRVLRACIRDREGLQVPPRRAPAARRDPCRRPAAAARQVLFQVFSAVIEAAARPLPASAASHGKWWFYLPDDPHDPGGGGSADPAARRPVVTQEDMYEAVWLPLHQAQVPHPLQACPDSTILSPQGLGFETAGSGLCTRGEAGGGQGSHASTRAPHARARSRLAACGVWRVGWWGRMWTGTTCWRCSQSTSAPSPPTRRWPCLHGRPRAVSLPAPRARLTGGAGPGRRR